MTFPKGEIVPATVHVAFGQHVNMYHSYRGDDPVADDGFGPDIRVISRSLDILERYPEVPLDWDFDCFETLEVRMPEHAPELLSRIRTRLAGGDTVRHMSWAGEALAWCNDDEFVTSIEKSRATIKSVLHDDPVEAIYPQEMMVTPDFPRLMTRAGLRWISLFYSASPFTAFRNDVELTPNQMFNPLKWVSPDGEWDTVVLPTYHHADVVDHGSLAQYVEWIHKNCDGNALLFICFDADAASWPMLLEQGLPQVAQLDYVRFTTPDRYVVDNEIVGEISIHKDLADGKFDGYGNWSEKPFNFEIFTELAAARRRDTLVDIYDPGARRTRKTHGALIDAKLRLLATTNYGLAEPVLHPDRVRSAREAARALKELSEKELAEARGDIPPMPGVVANVADGPILLDDGPLLEQRNRRRLRPVAKALVNENGLATEGVSLSLMEDGKPGPLVLGGVQVAGSGWLRSGFAVGDRLAEADLVSEPGDGKYRISGPYKWGDGSPAGGGVEFILSARGRSPVLRIDVTSDIPQVEGLTEVYPAAISPAIIGLPLFVSRHNFTGSVHVYEVHESAVALNNHVTNGWAGISDGSIGLIVAFDTTVLAGGAAIPMRIDDFEGSLAPLLSPFGTLWGEQPGHHPERSGGSGAGQQAAIDIGSHIRSSGPAFAGVRLRFRLGLTAFHGAHPSDSARAYALGVAQPPARLG